MTDENKKFQQKLPRKLFENITLTAPGDFVLVEEVPTVRHDKHKSAVEAMKAESYTVVMKPEHTMNGVQEPSRFMINSATQGRRYNR
jgi:hypothetical protein